MNVNILTDGQYATLVHVAIFWTHIPNQQCIVIGERFNTLILGYSLATLLQQIGAIVPDQDICFCNFKWKI